jgi:hypothetical protein
MLNFNKFLKEQVLNEEAATADLESDDKGKLHELLLAKHLNPEKNENGEGKLPLHHRSESENPDHSGSPQQVHDKLRAKVGEAAYQEINNHAKQTAAGVMEYARNNKLIPDGHEVESVHWTSNRDMPNKEGDHEKTTGIKDTASNGDLILTTRHKKDHNQKHYIPISAKYGQEEEPNYANKGLDSLAKEANLKSNTFTDIAKNHDDAMEGIGYSGPKTEKHAQYKIDKMGVQKARAEHAKLETKRQAGKLNPKDATMHKILSANIAQWDKNKSKENAFEAAGKTRAAAAEQSSLEARKQMARAHEQAFNGPDTTENDKKLREFIRNQVAPPTHFRHIIAHSHVQDDGSAVSHINEPQHVVNNHLSQYSNLKMRKGNGITSDIVGTDKNGKEVVIGRQGFKGVSGPHRGIAGFFKLEGTQRAVKAEKKVAKQSAAKTAPAKAPAKAPVVKKTVKPAMADSNIHGKSFYSPSEMSRFSDDGGRAVDESKKSSGLGFKKLLEMIGR